MSDLRIIIVAWNVEKHLERCLRSLSRACAGLDWDCVVVDNSSKDGSVAAAKRVMSDTPQIRVIANQDNRGFAKACNQGLTGLDARYVLLLNPDTECPPASLLGLVRAADEQPEAGIFGPKLVNSDGSVQTSIRRFPTFWSQLGIMLKLHNLFPSLFGRYFAKNMSLEIEQDVDQVMGSCFLIRRGVIEQIGGLDERYFLWFEEVDYCRQAKERGWSVRYIPSVAVTHHGGHSFGHVLSLNKQRYLNGSQVKYFQKWQPGWRPFVLRLFNPLSLAMAWLVGLIGLGGWGSRRVLHKSTLTGAARSVSRMRDGLRSVPRSGTPLRGAVCAWAVFIIILELVSALTIFRPIWNSVAAVAAGFIVAVLAWKRPYVALSALLLELFIGGKGYLLQLGVWPDAMSLRIVLFVAFMFGWAVNVLETGAWRRISGLLHGRLEWIALYVFVAYGVVRGLTLGNAPVFADANAWGFILLLVPTLDIASRYGQELRRIAAPLLVMAPVWLALKTLGLEYIYSHGIKTLSQPSYLWVRRTGVGEVTLVTANAFRIFMQSYIFALPAFLFGLSYYFATHVVGTTQASPLQPRRITNAVLVSSFVILAISLSRSLWIGSAAGLGTIIALFLFGQRDALPLHAAGKNIVRIASLCLAAIALIFVTLAFPVPRVDVASLATLFESRVSTEDAAAVSRWRLLDVLKTKIAEHPILGSGFGATVTYETKDPRIVAETGGLYTTHAFEWGWLEHWVKLGFFGVALMLVIIWRLGRRLLRMAEPRWIVVGSLATLIGLAVTHVFTPYLNHPLGFGMLFALETLAMMSKTDKVSSGLTKCRS